MSESWYRDLKWKARVMSWDMWMTYWVYYVQNIWDNLAFWLNKRKAFCTKSVTMNCLNIWFHIAIYTQYVTTGLIDLIFAERTPWINSLALGKLEWNFKYVIFKWIFSDWWLRYLLWNFLNMNVTGLHWWSVKIGSGNGLTPSGTKPLPEPMLTQIFVAIWCHWPTMS